MKSKNFLVMVGAIVVGLWSPVMAMADPVNEYFSTPMTQESIEVINSAPVVIEKNCSAPVLIERTVSAPVVIEKVGSPPILLEDRIIKQKHFFGIGIWPLFDFEIM